MAELDRFMREAEVLEATSLARSTLWREVKAKRFPSPVQITPGRVGWRQSDINRWLENRWDGRQQGPRERPYFLVSITFFSSQAAQRSSPRFFSWK